MTTKIAPELIDADVLNILRDTNYVINGNFDVWQRGTSFGPADLDGVYSADRWLCLSDGTGVSITVSRQAFTLGQTDVPGEPSYFLRSACGAATAETYNIIGQRIEGVRSLAGQTATLSFYAKVSSGTASVTPKAVQSFGTGGSPSADVTTSATACAVTTSWQKFERTIAIPTISGKTLGSTINNYLGLYFYLPVQTATTIDIARVKIERGDTATPFDRRNIVTEEALCKRFYQTGPLAAMRGAAAGAGEYASTAYTFQVSMRKAPTITINAITSANVGAVAALGTPTAEGGALQIPSAAAGDFSYLCSITADAEL